ncbi:hypothetical protein SBA3_2650010 [Candidatus Sulfopaludibacter sp. SbA3]|nr:hypothetical protein SBA3_2650010 [Candidatus Sulfopaludibacter sp. SbA3]
MVWVTRRDEVGEVAQRQDQACTMKAKAFSFTRRTKKRRLRMARYLGTARDLRRTGRVCGWRRSKQTYQRERSGVDGQSLQGFAAQARYSAIWPPSQGVSLLRVRWSERTGCTPACTGG